MLKGMHLVLLVGAVTSVAVADACLKKAASQGMLLQALTSPWMVGAVLLYLFQLFFFTYVFVSGWQLSIVGSLQTVLYALVVLGASLIFFQETLTRVQVVGIVLAVAGAILINLDL